MISYNEFKRLVPEETASFIEFALPYLNFYAKDSKILEFRNSLSTDNYSSKCFFLLLYAIAQNKDYETYFSKYGFNKSSIKIDKNSAISSKSTKNYLH